MKVFVVTHSEIREKGEEETGWYYLADSAVSNTGKPFYLPDSFGKTVASLGVAIRISRIGKCISEKYASRYYTEYAPVVHFTLPDYADKLKQKGLPQAQAFSFDRSLIVGDFISKEISTPISMHLNGKKESELVFPSADLSTEKLIKELSELNTMKMGDLIVVGLSNGIELNQDDFLEVNTGDERAFHVKVK